MCIPVELTCNCRFFCGVSSSPKQQRTLIENFFNECFKVWMVVDLVNSVDTQKNQSRARDGKYPVTYTECQEIASRVLAANKV